MRFIEFTQTAGDGETRSVLINLEDISTVFNKTTLEKNCWISFISGKSPIYVDQNYEEVFQHIKNLMEGK